MKKRMVRPVLLGLGVVTLSVITMIFVKKDNFEQSTNETEIDNLREQHSTYLKNSPYKETLKLTKSERKAKGLPPNRYFEQMWELTMNPATGKTEPEKIYAVQKQLVNTAKRAPGDAQDNPWIERGPNDVGGRTRAILFDPNDANNRRVYAGGVSGGLWVNNDITSAVSQWSRVQNVQGNLSVTSITVDPRNSNIWYVGTGEQYTGGDVVGNGVYRSTDGGTTWQAVNIPAAGGGSINFNVSNLFLSGIYYVNDIVAWNNTAQNRTELFVGVGAHKYGDSSGPTNWLGIQSAGIYRSIDGGANWNRIESANMRYQRNNVNYYYIPNDFEVGANNRLWVGTINSPLGNGGGRVFSSNDGAIWTEAAASPLNDSNRVELETSATNANKIYALTQGVARDANNDVIDPVHIYRSLDGFATAPTATILPNDVDNDIPANDFTRGQAFYDLMIESDPNNDNIVYVGGIDLFRSTNSGNAWSQISKWSNNNNLAGLRASIVHADQHAMVFRPGNSNQAIFGNDGGIFYANSLSTAANNNVFGARNNNYNVTQYVKAGIGPNGAGDVAGIFSAGAQDNGSQAFRNVVAGINGSEQLTGGDGFYTFVDKDGEYMIATYVHNVIYRFNLPWDGRGRIQGGATTLVDDERTGDFVNQMGYDSDANYLLSNASFVERVNNADVPRFVIKTIDVAANRNADITNALLTSKPTAFIASSFANNTWYVGTASGGLLRLTNVGLGAANWAEINTPFVGSVSSVRLGATANDIMVTIHNYGVTSIWYSSDAGANWSSKEGNLPDIPVRDILQNPLDRTEVIVATQLGVWVTTNFDAVNPNWVRSQNGMSDASVTSFDYWEINGDQNNNKIIASTYGRGIFTGSFTANGVQDNEAPTAPTNLVTSNITQTTIDLGWTASNDNVGVTEYDVYQDGVVIATINAINRTVTGLTANTTYAFKVRAKDAAGNVSADSNIVNPTTSAAAADPCNGGATLTANSGNFEDGSGAQNYGNNQNCTWLIKPGNGGTVTLNFDSYNTESGYDFVTVYDGENANAAQLGRFSGAAIPNQMVSTGNAMFVRFTSDVTVTLSGWAARYTSTALLVDEPNSDPCNGGATLTTNSGNFEDGSGTQDYGNNRNCTWLIRPVNGGTVTLNFDSYNTESGYDFVTVYDGENANAAQLGRFSGAAIPNQIVSTGNVMFVQFTSDGSITESGWAARYTSNIQGGAVVGRSDGNLTDLTLDNEESKVFDVSFYPNPVEDIMYINTTKTTSSINYKIMNITGQIVNQGVIHNNNSIDVQNLTKGVYILVLKSEKDKSIKQFVRK